MTSPQLTVCHHGAEQGRLITANGRISRYCTCSLNKTHAVQADIYSTTVKAVQSTTGGKCRLRKEDEETVTEKVTQGGEGVRCNWEVTGWRGDAWVTKHDSWQCNWTENSVKSLGLNEMICWCDMVFLVECHICDYKGAKAPVRWLIQEQTACKK